MGAIEWEALGGHEVEESLAPLMTALGALSVGFVIGVLDLEGNARALAYNDTFVKMTGGMPHGPDSAQHRGRVFRADRQEPMPPSEMPGIKAAATGQPQRNVEVHILMGDGSWRLLSVSSIPLPVTTSSRRMWLSILVDITERQQALLSSEEELRLALDAAQMGTWHHDLDSDTMRLDERAQQQHGVNKAELPSRELFAMIHPDDRAALWRKIAGMTGPQRLFSRVSGEFRILLPDGQVRWLMIHAQAQLDGNEPGRGRFVHGTSLDITERKRLEDQLLQSQKMETIGRLAGGMAHDFNNILVAILGYAELLEESLPDGPERQDVAEIRRAGERARELTRQLLTIARRQVNAPRQIDLNELLRDSTRFLQRIVGEDVRVLLGLAPGQVPVMIDPTQMHQVVMNLAVNARDAMPSGGQLCLSTDVRNVDPGQARLWLDARPGPHAVLTVSDSGIGLSPEVQAHLFEPFFTTKEQGRGTGLGLATAHGIVKQAGGFIHAESEPGKGTAFRIFLPLSSASWAPTAVSPAPRVLGGAERILLVEDDAAARVLSARVLREAGYNVTVACNGREALVHVQSLQHAPDLLLTDVVMPEMGGKQLAEQMLRRYPDLLVLFLSGYSENIIAHHGVLEPGLQFLAKPFTPSQLLARVSEVLAPLRDLAP